jgi:hypothetical protein
MSTPGRAWLVALTIVLVVASGGAVAWDRLQGPTRCQTDGERLTVSGPQTEPFEEKDLKKRTVVDARGAAWRGREPYVVELTSSRRACLSGGKIRGTWTRDTSWEKMHGTGAVIMAAPRATVEDLRVDGYGDSIRLVEGAGHFVVRRVHLSFSRDDCVENDWLYTGTVSDSLLDGCYNAFSARSYEDVPDGDDHVWTIKSSLVRLEPMPRTYNDDKPVPGTAGFFKWDDHGPQLVLTGNVFRADQRAGPVGLGLPRGKLKKCSDNVMVWLGKGRYPAHLPRCFKVTRDEKVWDAAVRKWKQNHD